MSDRKIVIAQLGCGYWGPNVLRNFSAQPGCLVKFVVEINPERQAYVRMNFPRSEVVSSVDTVLNDSEVAAVVIATPASSHYELAKQVLQSNKHAFVEKPLATSTAQADELVKLAEQHKKTLMVGHTFLYNAAVRYARQLLADEELGKLYYIYSQRLNLGQVRSDVNAWWNLAPHDVSILLYLMNNELPVSVAAEGVSYIQPGIEDVVFATLKWANGVIGHIHVSWLDPGKIRKMTLVGSRKMVVYDDIGDDKIKIFDKGVDRVPKIGERMDYDVSDNFQLIHRTGDIWLPKISFQEPLKTEASHFLECLRNGQPPLTGPKHARDVVAVLEATQNALSSGQVVTLE
ncbi:MAG TPA: Gfo/Idh/MocA family oxidoreductase [Pyrinomonadaceae bacterium]|jgi:predicted dehydrogenase|nr:Gfo/Idh/MocA family oxidoreductase [Pyrinomonadaceae bacterium]